MEQRTNACIEKYLHGFKSAIKTKILDLELGAKAASDLLGFVNDYENLTITKEEMVKPKKRDEKVTKCPVASRCLAKRATGEQCTRRRKDDAEFCGTHCKGAPHGQVASDATVQHIELFTQKISGIVYFLDHSGHVYNTEQVMSSQQNPAVIATWVKDAEGRYTIPEFGFM
jgi:hypothetical protein